MELEWLLSHLKGQFAKNWFTHAHADCARFGEALEDLENLNKEEGKHHITRL